MKASELKASILQLAVSGKLVAQDPNDEPACVLLQRIQAERKKARVKGEVLPAVSEDEQPFTTPASWVWTRLGNIGTWSAGGTPSRTKTEYYFNGTIPWLKSGDLNDGFITHSDEKITDLATKETRVPINKIGSLVVALYGATIGKTGILSIEATTNQACCVCNIYVGIDNRYLNYYIISQRASLKKSGAGRAQPNISKEKLVVYPIPLPPLAEQQRIVARIEELMPLVEAYDREEQKLSALEAELPEALRQSILQYAVEGKLVSQKAEDGTAAELLVKIRKEREALVKEGKIKKGKPLSPVSEEEKPFSIPESWEWVRLGEVCLKLTDGTHHSPPNTQNGEYKYISAKNITSNGIDLSNVTYINKSLHDEIYARCDPCYGDILYIKDGATTGVVTINNLREPFSLLSSVALLKIPKEINVKYLVYFMRSPYFYAYIRKEMFGTAITRVTLEKLNQAPILLPPLAEQQRIVVCVDELMGLCDRL